MILIAADATDTRELYADYFSSPGDLAMPQFDGLTAIRRIKAHPRAAQTRLILLTGYPQKAVERGALNAGADRFLTKPCVPEELERHVKELARRGLSA